MTEIVIIGLVKLFFVIGVWGIIGWASPMLFCPCELISLCVAVLAQCLYLCGHGPGSYRVFVCL